MYCNKCGKEIPDSAQFCNYCGSPVNNFQYQQAYVPQTAQRPAPAKKKGGIAKFIIPGVVGLIVFFVVSFITQALLTSKPQTSNPPIIPSSSSEESYVEPTVSLTDPCIYGAVYQYNFLTYGLTELYIPNYTLSPGEGNEPDGLISPDENFMFTCTKQLEIMEISYNASDREGMIASFGDDAFTILIDYQKYYVDGYPVIRYIARTDMYGDEKYVGELIVFPSETTKETIRLQMYAREEGGYDEINRIFDSLNIVPAEFAPSAENSSMVGFNRITVK